MIQFPLGPDRQALPGVLVDHRPQRSHASSKAPCDQGHVKAGVSQCSN
jgi:hypothetical protein